MHAEASMRAGSALLAYIQFELSSILSRASFDHDRKVMDLDAEPSPKRTCTEAQHNPCVRVAPKFVMFVMALSR